MSAPASATETNNKKQEKRIIQASDLRQNDVLVGRGVPFVQYPGNVRFRELVKKNAEEYMSTSRHHVKDNITREIIDTVLSRKGRFLKKLESRKDEGVFDQNGLWELIGPKQIRDKVKQAFRDFMSRELKKEAKEARARLEENAGTTATANKAAAAAPSGRNPPPRQSSSSGTAALQVQGGVPLAVPMPSDMQGNIPGLSQPMMFAGQHEAFQRAQIQQQLLLQQQRDIAALQQMLSLSRGDYSDYGQGPVVQPGPVGGGDIMNQALARATLLRRQQEESLLNPRPLAPEELVSQPPHAAAPMPSGMPAGMDLSALLAQMAAAAPSNSSSVQPAPEPDLAQPGLQAVSNLAAAPESTNQERVASQEDKAM